VSAYFKALGARYLHKPVTRPLSSIVQLTAHSRDFSVVLRCEENDPPTRSPFSWKSTSGTIEVWHLVSPLNLRGLTGYRYAAFGFAAALLEDLPVVGLIFAISNRIGAVMWAHGLPLPLRFGIHAPTPYLIVVFLRRPRETAALRRIRALPKIRLEWIGRSSAAHHKIRDVGWYTDCLS
jgi:hypothetical protein